MLLLWWGFCVVEVSSWHWVTGAPTSIDDGTQPTTGRRAANAQLSVAQQAHHHYGAHASHHGLSSGRCTLFPLVAILDA